MSISELNKRIKFLSDKGISTDNRLYKEIKSKFFWKLAEHLLAK